MPLVDVGEVERLGIDEGVGRLGVAQHDALDDLGAVDGDVHRLAHALVGHHRPRDLVAVIHELEVGLGFLDIQIGRGLDLLDELQRDLVGDVELSAHAWRRRGWNPRARS